MYTSQYCNKPTWNGSALRALGNVTRDTHTLRELFEEACQQAINEGVEKNFYHVCVKPEHVHKAASILTRRRNDESANILLPARFTNKQTEGGQ